MSAAPEASDAAIGAAPEASDAAIGAAPHAGAAPPQARDEAAVGVQVRALVLELAPIQPTQLDPQTSLVVDLGYDSLRLVELVVALEDHFGLPAAGDEDATDVETVADVEQRVLELLRAHAEALASAGVAPAAEQAR